MQALCVPASQELHMTSTVTGKAPSATATAPTREVELSIGGMTCASCAARV